MLGLQPNDIGAFLTPLLLLLQNALDRICKVLSEEAKAFDEDKGSVLDFFVHDVLKDMNMIVSTVFCGFKITHSIVLIENELGY
jgi:hypothetical protein